MHETLGSDRGVQLLRTNPRQEELLTRLGATRSKGGWRIARSDPFPFTQMEKVLPRMAHRSIAPEVVDLIPASAWFASLANMLVESSWDLIRRPVTNYHGGCQECGTWKDPEAHELWSYDPQSGVQTLKSIRSLCYPCHETQHLGRANVTGRFDLAFDRLCRLNRIRDAERSSYKGAIFGKWEDRSAMDWSLDLSVAFSMAPHLFLKGSVVYGGDNWVVQPASGRHGEVATRIVNAEVLSDGKRLVIAPIGTAAQGEG